MSIVATEIESIHGGTDQQRLIFYRCHDSDGVWHSYGPVISSDPSFDADVHKAVVEAKVAESLAANELDEVLR
jgi:hypothetical protein